MQNEQNTAIFPEMSSLADDLKVNKIYQTEAQILTNMPQLKDLSAKSDPDIIALSTIALKNRHLEKIISKLPNPIDLKDISFEAQNLMDILIDKNLAKNILLRLPKSIAWQTISIGGGAILAHLINEKYGNFILTKLPPTLDFKDINLGVGLILEELARQGHGNAVMQRLPSLTYLSQIPESAGEFLKVLADAGFAKPLMDKLPNPINLNNLSRGAIKLLASLIENNLANEILNRIPSLTQQTNTPLELFPLLAALVNKGHGEKFISQLPGSINFQTLSYKTAILLEAFIKQGYGKTILDRITGKIDLTNLFHGTTLILNTLAEQGYASDLLDKLPDLIPLNQIELETSKFLAKMIEQGFGKNILTRLPKLLTLEEIKGYSDYFLVALIEHGFGQTLIDRLPNSIDWENFPIDELPLIIQAFIDHGYGPAIEAKWFRRRLEDLRKPIQISEAELPKNKVGPTIADIIANFPIDWQAEKTHSGWHRYELEKGGSQTFVWIYLDPQDENKAKIIFRNRQISTESLHTYITAISYLPTGISRAFYPELQQTTNLDKFYDDGFREVFAGPSLWQIDLENIPPALKKSILEQKNFISAFLILKNIFHGHTHEGNFNVRFLLTNENGKKTILFDVNEALRIATAEHLTITPIATLRDWDQARSSNKPTELTPTK